MSQSSCSYTRCSIRETITREIDFFSSRSIDSMISSYALPSISTRETSVPQVYNLDNLKPLLIEMGGNEQKSLVNNVYERRGMDVNSAIRYSAYSGQDRIGYNKGYNPLTKKRGEYFSPDVFLRNDRPSAQFIGSVEEIKHYINESFEKTMRKELPEDIVIRVVSGQELKMLHNDFGNGHSAWSPGIQGFSINRKGFGQSLIFVKENELDRLLITIGHEIGHVINFSLANKLDEEAKAFAFEMAWVKALYENDIAGLRNSINPDPMPAKNGLHDVAFSFVKSLLARGMDAFDIFVGLMKHEIRVNPEM